ncbi:MAG: hypothetical protein IJF21_01995, partial [Clostridia bacterium]|nr:hypothetical protein [Clostridia bacterium]
TFFEKEQSPICDKEVLKSLGADVLLYDSRINISDYFSDDIDVLKRRSIVFSDALNVRGLYDLLVSISGKLASISDILRSECEIGDKERSIFSAKQLELYFEIIDEAENYYTSLPKTEHFASEEFAQLFDRIHGIATSREYHDLKEGTRKLIEKITRIKSISVGFNFDAKLSPVEMGIISVNDQYIESGKLVDKILRMDFAPNGLQAIEPIIAVNKSLKHDEFELLQDSILRSVDKIFVRAVKSWPREFTKYIADKLAFLLDLLPDLQFILAVTNIHKKLLGSGVPVSKPIYHEKSERVFRAEGLFNPVLAIRMSELGQSGIVGNDFEFDENGQIFILTGPNNGGKSVFLSSIGLAQVLAGLGMLVPAKRIEISPVDRLFVHFPKYSNSEKMGRLEDECLRIKEIFKNLNAESLCLFDETFSSTDSEEGCQIAFEILRAVESLGARALFGTHFHNIVRHIEDEKAEGRCVGFDYLSAGIYHNEKRTYKITRTKPSGKSHASDIAAKYGLSFNSLVNK